MKEPVEFSVAFWPDELCISLHRKLPAMPVASALVIVMVHSPFFETNTDTEHGAGLQPP